MDIHHHPEVVSNNAGYKRLELLGISQEMIDPAVRRSGFANKSDEEFKQMLGYVNALGRRVARSNEYEDGVLPSLSTPALSDKAALMGAAYEATRTILADPLMNDADALRRAGLTLAGALNYIHPYKDGNGRTGRVMHYLMEFGTQRGKVAFGEELYAIIAKTSVYDTDEKVALYDTPPSSLDHALGTIVQQSTVGTLDDREFASARALAFLDMMTGNITIPILQKAVIVHGSRLNGTLKRENIIPNTTDGLTLYEYESRVCSAVNLRLPSEVPIGASLINAQPNQKAEFINIDISLV